MSKHSHKNEEAEKEPVNTQAEESGANSTETAEATTETAPVQEITVEEELTKKINELTGAKVKIEMRARHMCMEMRGVNTFGSETVVRCEIV